METASVRANGRTGTSGATVVAIIALLASGIGLVFCAMFAFGAFAPLFLVEDPGPSGPYVGEISPMLDEAGSPYGALASVVGIILGVASLLMARRRGERARAALTAVFLGLLGLTLVGSVFACLFLLSLVDL